MEQAADPAPPGDHDEASEAGELHALLADTSDLAAIVDGSGRIRYLNRAGHQILGRTGDRARTDLTILDAVAESDRATFTAEVLPSLHLDGWWSGSLKVAAAPGRDVDTRTTLRIHRRGQPDDQVITWVARDVSTENAVYRRLQKQVFEDELTGLPHRTIFLDRLDMALRPTDDAGPVALLFLSLDRFKEKNDRYGREVGDHLLRSVAQRLDESRGDDDTLCRWGGDEFVVLCSAAQIDPLSTQLLEAFSTPFDVAGTDVFLSASIGVASGAPGLVDSDQLLRQADAAGQMAKHRGGGTIHRFDEEMRARALRRAEVEDALRGAADRGELVLHYQPEVSLRSNEIVAVEALVRWHHPQWGLVAPSEFVPVAETSALILELGQWVLSTAMDQCARWRSLLGDRTPTMAINISGRQFLQDDFVEAVASTLEHTGADAGDVCLEITESVLMDDLELTADTLRRLKGLGVQLAIDDFGTGYSSLSYLRRFPIDVLKVDQSFVSGLGYDPEDSAIVQAVVHMGRALQLTTVAEGVETAHHLIELRELDCDIAQGFHFARPGPVESITPLLEAGPDWPRLAV